MVPPGLRHGPKQNRAKSLLIRSRRLRSQSASNYRNRLVLLLPLQWLCPLMADLLSNRFHAWRRFAPRRVRIRP